MEHSPLSDRELLKACINDDKDARDAFTEKYTKLVYRYIYSTFTRCNFSSSREDIEDLHNDIFLSLFKDNCRKLRQYRGDNNCSVAGWIVIVAASMALNFASRSRSFTSLDDESAAGGMRRHGIPDAQVPVLEQLINGEQVQMLNAFIEKLKEEDKLMVRYYLEGLSSREIGNILNRSPNAVDTRISRIRKKLKDALDNLQ